MTIQLTQTLRIGGSVVTAGSEVTLSAADEASLVHLRRAVYLSGDASIPVAVQTPVTAESYGVSTINSAAANGTALQYALNQGGLITLLKSGTYALPNSTFTVPAGTQLLVGPGVAFTVNGSPAVPATLAAALVQFAASVCTWATLPSASASLQRTVFVTDVGVGGSHWYSDGSRWRPVGGRVTLKNAISSSSNNTTTKTVLDYAVIPAGLWADGDLLEVDFVKERTGGTSDTDNTDVLIGTAATTVGSTLWDASNGLTNALATTTLVMRPAITRYRRESATSVRPLAPAGNSGSGTATAANTVKTVPNLDQQATYLQITSKLTSGAGETAWLRGFTVALVAGA